MGRRKNYTSTSIPASLFKRVKKHIKGTGFTSVSGYVTYILREIVSGGRTKSVDKDQERVKERLRALGYIK